MAWLDPLYHLLLLVRVGMRENVASAVTFEQQIFSRMPNICPIGINSDDRTSFTLFQT